MTLKLGGLGISTFAGGDNPNVSLLDGKSSKNGQDKFPVPSQISVQTGTGEDPVKVHQRMLREAASRAGLDATAQQETFVKKYAAGIKFADPKKDPSPSDDSNVKAGEVKNENVSYTLGRDEIDSLVLLQKEYLATGNKLHPGKSYQSAPNNAATARQAINDEAQQRYKLNQLLRNAQLLPTAFGTPSKLRDLKHISVTLSTNPAAGLSNEDHALLAYLQKSYGTGNLQGDNIKEILELSKINGVRAENLKIENAAAKFDVSVENLLKMHTAYIAVQTKTNVEIEIFKNASDNTVANRFVKGVYEGAWEDLKANGQAIADPLGTISKLAETVRQLAAINPVLLGAAIGEMAVKSPELLKQGAATASQTKVGDAAEAAGKLVGAAAVELVLGKTAAVAFKGIAFLGKTESGMRLLQQIGGATQKAKQAIGALEIPVGAAEIVLTNGSKIKLPFGEVKRLDELLAPLESRAKQVLSSGVEKVKAINLPAWDKLTFRVDKGETVPHFLTGHKAEGTRLAQSVKDGGRKSVFPEGMSDKQITNSIKEAYKRSEKIGTQIDGNGDKIVELLGEADGMKIKMYVNVTTKQLDSAFPIWELK